MTDAMILIGVPGAGKSTLAEHLTADLPHEESDSPIPFRRYDCGVYEIGKRRAGGFSGTDALAMNAQPKVLEFIEAMRPRLLFFEGDRLTNNKMFHALQDLGYTLHLYELWGTPAKVASQRAGRGSNQDPTWLAGRVTKVKNIRHAWTPVVLPAGNDLDDLVSRLGDPVSVAFRRAKGWAPEPTAEQIEEARLAAI